MTPVAEVNGFRYIDLWFTDLLGHLRSITIPAEKFKKYLSDGLVPKLDGSSVDGFASIDESDMTLIPDLRTLRPVSDDTARVICYVALPGGKESPRDPRTIAAKAEEKLAKSGMRVYLGSEMEFFVFSEVSVRYVEPWYQLLKVRSPEAPWSGSPTFIHRRKAYYASRPYDTVYEFRRELAKTLEDFFGISVEAHHHEVATAGQIEVDIDKDSLVNTADYVVTLKYVAKNVAKSMGLVATFMPKPLFGDNASGMHVHVSLWSDGKNLFHDPSDDYAGISETARYFIGGLLMHARALSAIVSPTVNSYRRLVPGYEAPVYLVWSKANRSAAVRVPVYNKDDAPSKRVEYRPPDPSANPYLAFVAILAAGLDGIRRKADPGPPVDRNVYAMSKEERREKKIGELPGSLKEALDELEEDNKFLREFIPKETIETYIELKREEVREFWMRPTVVDFYYYFAV